MSYHESEFYGMTDESERRENARLDEEYEEAQMLIYEARAREEALAEEDDEASPVAAFVKSGDFVMGLKEVA
jgi:hypothetical protein